MILLYTVPGASLPGSMKDLMLLGVRSPSDRGIDPAYISESLCLERFAREQACVPGAMCTSDGLGTGFICTSLVFRQVHPSPSEPMDRLEKMQLGPDTLLRSAGLVEFCCLNGSWPCGALPSSGRVQPCPLHPLCIIPAVHRRAAGCPDHRTRNGANQCAIRICSEGQSSG